MAANQGRHPDLKYKYIRGLLHHERQQRRKHWLKSAAEWTSKAVVSLELHPASVKTTKEASNLEGIGRELRRKLDEVEESNTDVEPPQRGRFISSAPALLVSLYIAKLQAEQLADRKLTRVTMREGPLCELAGTMCEETFLNLTDESGDTDDLDTDFDKAMEKKFCMAWWRMTVLMNRNLVKKRSVDKLPVYELLPEGENLAKHLKRTARIPDSILENMPEIPVHTVPNLKNTKTPRKKQNDDDNGTTSTSKKRKRITATKAQMVELDDDTFLQRNLDEEALYIRDDGSDGIVLLFDTQELGGGRLGLGEIARLLDQTQVRYRSKKLETGDYVWIWRSKGREIQLPFIIERKRADDLARSIRDGRYESQKLKMLQWRETFRDLTATLTYLIEGDPRQYVVKCGCGCGGVLKCGWPTAAECEREIGVLDRSIDFDLIRTNDISETVEFLATVNDELKLRLDRGDFNILRKKAFVTADGDGIEKRPKLTRLTTSQDDLAINIDISPPGSPNSTTEIPYGREDTASGSDELNSYRLGGVDLPPDRFDFEEDDIMSPRPKSRSTPKCIDPPTKTKVGSFTPKDLNMEAAPLSQYHCAKSSPALFSPRHSATETLQQDSVHAGHLPHRSSSFDPRSENNSGYRGNFSQSFASAKEREKVGIADGHDSPNKISGMKGKSSRKLFTEQSASLSPLKSAYSWGEDEQRSRSPSRSPSSPPVRSPSSPQPTGFRRTATSAHKKGETGYSDRTKNKPKQSATYSPMRFSPGWKRKATGNRKPTARNCATASSPQMSGASTSANNNDIILLDDSDKESDESDINNEKDAHNYPGRKPKAVSSTGRKRPWKFIAKLPSFDDGNENLDSGFSSAFSTAPGHPSRFNFSGISGLPDTDSDESLPDLPDLISPVTKGTSRLQAFQNAAANIGSNNEASTGEESRVHFATEDKINAVLVILPHFSRDRIRAALNRCSGNTEACLSLLLDD